MISNPIKLFYSHLDTHQKYIYFHFIIALVISIQSFMFLFITLGQSFEHIPIFVIIIIVIFGFIYLSSVIIYIVLKTNLKNENDMVPFLAFINKYIPFSNKYVSISIGFLILIADFFYNIFLSSLSEIGDKDIVFLIIGFLFIFYPFIPKKYYKERDFILLFFIFDGIFLYIIPTIFNYVSNGYIYYFLVLPTSGLLNIIGIDNYIYGTNIIFYITQYGTYSSVFIARVCSGMYSLSIFISAFVTFIIVEYQKIDIKSLLFLIIGIILVYMGNIVRMIIIILAGHYYGDEALLWTHENLGYIIFFAWSGIFWVLLYKYLLNNNNDSKK